MDPDFDDSSSSSDDSLDEDAEDIAHLWLMLEALYEILDDGEFEVALLAEVAKLEEQVKPPRKKRRPSHMFRTSSSVDIMQYLDENKIAEDAFWQVFRMKRSTFHKLMEVVGNAEAFQNAEGKVCQTPPAMQMLIFIAWLVKGEKMADIAETYGIGIATVFVIQRRCIAAISEFMHSTWSFPTTSQEFEEQAQLFEKLHMIPGCVGIIDGTMIPIHQPLASQTHEPKRYFNYKSRNALGMQLLVDARGRIQSAHYGYVGSVQDTGALREWDIFRYRRHLEQKGMFFMADSGYPLRPYLITPFDVKEISCGDRVRSTFNWIFCGRRCLVERVIGRLKGRFRVLYKRTFIRNLPKMQSIIGVCIFLYNFCFDAGDHLPPHLEHPDRIDGRYVAYDDDDSGTVAERETDAEVVERSEQPTVFGEVLRSSLIECSTEATKGFREGTKLREELVKLLTDPRFIQRYKKLPTSFI